MAYEIYKTKLKKEDYFNNWNDESYKSITEDLQEEIYNKYIVKCEIFVRDNFTCQNLNCPFCHNEKEYKELTAHHVKAQRNGGKNTVRNEVTLCRTSHQSYEKAKNPLVFGNFKHLPKNLRGHTFRLNKDQIINWKQVRAEMKKFRKTLKNQYGIIVTWEELSILMKFLRFAQE